MIGVIYIASPYAKEYSCMCVVTSKGHKLWQNGFNLNMSEIEGGPSLQKQMSNDFVDIWWGKLELEMGSVIWGWTLVSYLTLYMNFVAPFNYSFQYFKQTI